MLRLFVLSSFMVAAVAAVACDPYSPDLGAVPYRCGTSDPKCPDGYDEVQVGPPNLCECHKHEADPDPPGTPDAGPQGCASDPREPNDTIATATTTPISASAFTAVFNNQSICSLTDLDTYLFTTNKPNQTMKATVSYTPANGQLFVRIIDMQGVPVGQAGMPSGATALVATVSLPTQGTYYVQVGSTNGTNTYGLSLVLE